MLPHPRAPPLQRALLWQKLDGERATLGSLAPETHDLLVGAEREEEVYSRSSRISSEGSFDEVDEPSAFEDVADGEADRRLGRKELRARRVIPV